MMTANRKSEAGFTLVELLLALVVGSVLLAGLYANFAATSQVETTQIQYTERLQDLRIASQIMRNELRLAQTVSDATAKRIIYTDIDGQGGYFRFKPAANPPSLCWKQPGGATCQELLRDLDKTTGLQRSIDGDGILSVTLNSSYMNANRETGIVTLNFRIWPRN